MKEIKKTLDVIWIENLRYKNTRKSHFIQQSLENIIGNYKARNYTDTSIDLQPYSGFLRFKGKDYSGHDLNHLKKHELYGLVFSVLDYVGYNG